MLFPEYLHPVSVLTLIDAIVAKPAMFLLGEVVCFRHHTKVEKSAQKIQFHEFLLYLILHSKNFHADVPLQYASSLFPHHAILLRPANYEKRKG